MSVISMKQLLEAGVHFGHQTRRWNPKMAPYIFTERNGIHIIDLQKSVGKVDEAYKAVFEIAAQGGTILFVGTKKQAQDAVKTEAERCGMYFVNVYWNFLDCNKNICVSAFCLIRRPCQLLNCFFWQAISSRSRIAAYSSSSCFNFFLFSSSSLKSFSYTKI